MATLAEQIERAALELARAREVFQAAQGKFDALLGQLQQSRKPDSGQQQPTGDTVQDGGNGAPPTRAEQLIALLNTNPDRRWTYEELLPKMGGMKLPALRVLVYTLKKKGKIESSGYGQIKAAKHS
jgi:hypothetical protein